jgi:ABC-type lipoprotein release transport system permease subunit
MSLKGFRYLHKQHIIPLVLILTLTSVLFSVTAFSFLSFYNGFASYVGEEENVVAIYDRRSSTPFTGLIPTYLTEQVNSIDGVLASSPETITPCVVNNQSIFIRGIVPEEFVKLNNITLIEGNMLNLSNINTAIIGKGLAEKLNLKLNDEILVFSVLSEKHIQLQVKGICESNPIMDDEALVPLYVGQWLRGAGYSYVTLIRAKIDFDQLNANSLYAEIIKTSQPTATPQPTATSSTKNQLAQLIPYAQTHFDIDRLNIEQTQTFMKNYLNRYGVSKDTLLSISVVVLFFASGTAASALTMFLNQHKREIDILQSIGASKRKIKIDLLSKVLTWSLISSTLGTIIAATLMLLFEKVGNIQVLSHRLFFQLDPLIVALNFTLILSLTAFIVARSGGNQ